MREKKQIHSNQWLLLLVLSTVAASTTVAQVVQGPTVRQDIHHDVSPPLLDLIKHAPPPSLTQQEAEPVGQIPLPPGLVALEEDPVRQRSISPLTPITGHSFNGLGRGQYGFTDTYIPPDTNGAVGATQYVQWVNASFAIFSKSTGTLIAGPTAGNTLWAGFGGGCQNNNDGDPIVLYDKLAQRWVMSQFSISGGPFLQCVAVSTSSDATGTWNRYSFQYSNLDDYPKMGVWADGYYETFNMFSGGTFVGSNVCAYNRTAMLNDTSASQICFQQAATVGGLLPADIDGTVPPPAGSPNYMINFGANSLNLYKFHADFNVPSHSTFTGPTVIGVASFSPLCGGGRNCVPQPGTTVGLDSLADRLMYRLAYRNFGTHESLVVNHSVAVSGGGGVRWYEIQNPSGTPTVAQQGTFAPDSTYRWMASAAMDQAGDLAVGYSKSSTSVYPSIAFAGRVPTDPAGTLETETSVVRGTGSQTGYTRWGDYSAMTVDPIDDCTFWYTQEYMNTTSSAKAWNTVISSFKFSSCGAVNLNPGYLNFGFDPVGQPSGPLPVTLTNNQPMSLSISNINWQFPNGIFYQTNNCGTLLRPHSSCTINIVFTPRMKTTYTGVLNVYDNGPGSPQQVTLTGTGD